MPAYTATYTQDTTARSTNKEKKNMYCKSRGNYMKRLESENDVFIRDIMTSHEGQSLDSGISAESTAEASWLS